VDGHFPTHLGWKKPSAVGDHASSNGRAPIRGQYPFLSGSEGSIIDYETGSLQFWMGYTKEGKDRGMLSVDRADDTQIEASGATRVSS